MWYTRYILIWDAVTNIIHLAKNLSAAIIENLGGNLIEEGPQKNPG